MLERDGEAVIRERIRSGIRFARKRPGEIKRDLVPLLEFACDDHATIAVRAGLGG